MIRKGCHDKIVILYAADHHQEYSCNEPAGYKLFDHSPYGICLITHILYHPQNRLCSFILSLKIKYPSATITTRIGNPEDNRFAIKMAIRAVTSPKLAMIPIAASTESTEQITSVIVTPDTVPSRLPA